MEVWCAEVQSQEPHKVDVSEEVLNSFAALEQLDDSGDIYKLGKIRENIIISGTEVPGHGEGKVRKPWFNASRFTFVEKNSRYK